MNKQVIQIGFAIIIISILIYIIKNINTISEYIKKRKNISWISKIFLLILVIGVVIYIGNTIKTIISNIEFFVSKTETEKISLIYDEKILKENTVYNEIIKKEYLKQNPQNPYIPENFEYVEGEWNTGFVIQDEKENQYVWVPCTNVKNEEIPILERKSFVKESLIRKEFCTNEKYEEFLRSALENGGFYVSRYEIGKENNKPVSKSNVEIWSGVTRDEAIKVIEDMYSDINCELINGYAYDTTLSWLMMKNELLTNSVGKNKQEVRTGRKAYNNIYDFMDDVMEMTLETNYDTVIIRGYTYEDVFGMESEDLDRLSILSSDNFFTNATILGFRTVLYK